MSTYQKDARAVFRAYEPSIDWVTVTTREGSAWGAWLGAIERISGIRRIDAKRVNIMQYEGYLFQMSWGTAWCGSALQGGADHIMMRLSGNAPDELHAMWKKSILEGWGKVTRIDLQITVSEPEEWNQWYLFNRLKKSGKNVSYISSETGATVYIGNRQSERMTRLYEKLNNSGEKFLRWETEYKGNRASAIARAIARDEDGAISGRLLHEIQTCGDAATEQLFAPNLLGAAVTDRISVHRSYDKTEKWLLDQCLPAFVKVINSHSSDGTVLLAFLDAAMKAVQISDIERLGDVAWPIEETPFNGEMKDE